MIERHWLASITVVIAIGTNLLALTSVMHAGSWLVWAVGFSAVIALSMCLARAIIRPVLPALVGLLVAVCTMTAVYCAPEALAGIIPTSGSMQTLGALFRQGTDQVFRDQAPTDPTVGLTAVVIGATGLLTVVMILIAVDLALPALAGVLLLGYWVFPVLLRPPSMAIFVAGAAGFLLLLAGTMRGHTGRERWPVRRRPPVVAALVAGSVVVGVAMPAVAAQLPWWGQTATTTTGRAGGSGGISLNLAMDIRDNLENRSREVLLTTRSPRELGPLRLYSMTDFDGRNWKPSPEPALSALPAAADLNPAWPGPVSPLYNDSDSFTAEVKVGQLVESRLPLALSPRSVQVSNGWRYDANTDEVVGRGNTRGLTYTMTVRPSDVTPAALRAAPRSSGQSDYLAVPDTSHRDQIAALADRLTADAPTQYDQLIALQNYFRESGDFTYSLIVPAAKTSDAVWDFLNSKQGFCVQFATAMVVMGRTLGIPMRLAVGFLPGLPDGDGGQTITGNQAHAWPEAYFAGIGWTRFEPTPAQQSGAAAPWQGTSASPSPRPSAQQGTSRPSTATPSQSAAAMPNGTASDTAVRVIVPAVAVVVVLLALVFWRRRNRLELLDSPAGAAWRDVCKAGRRAKVSWPPGATPRTIAGMLASVVPNDPEALAALRTILDAYELDRFSPTSTGASPTDLRASRDRVARALKARRSDGAYPSAPPFGS